ncbi:MAG: AMP-binding protein [Gordonia amarae]
MTPNRETIDAAAHRHAVEMPDATAFSDPRRTLTWQQLDAAADAFAAHLAALGIGPGDRVGYLGPNAVNYPVTLLGTWRRGATIVGLNFRLPAADLTAIAAEVKLSFAVIDKRMEDLAHDIADYTAVVSSGDNWPFDYSAPAVAAHEPGEDDEALVYFTSGSTGLPKAVPLTHRAIEATLPFSAPHDLTAAARALVIPPTFHAAGGTWANFGIYLGFTTFYSDDASPAGIAAAIAGHEITHALMVPTMIHSLLDEVTHTGRRLPSLTHIGYGAAPITQHLLDKALDLLGCDFCQVYGLTESGGGMAFLLPADHRADADPTRRASTGRAGEGVQVQARSPEGKVLGAGESGQLWFRGPSITSGYLNNPEATAAVLVEGWLNTRDVGHIDSAGYIFIEGRADDMICTGGENVHPQAVEEVLCILPGVDECAVFGLPDEHWGQRVAAAIVVDDAHTLTAADVTEWLTGKLAKYQIPKTVLFTDGLPRTASGKIRRTDLVRSTSDKETTT